MANETTLRLTVSGPEASVAAFRAAHIVENTKRAYDGSPVRLSFETFAAYPSGEGRNWAYKHWGSAYNAGYFEFIRDEPGLIECRFCAYNGDAEPIFRAIARLFPDLSGIVQGEEEGGFYCCTGKFRGGKYRLSRFDWSKEHYAVVHGRPHEDPEDEAA